jgi:hypothetical protein
VIENNVDPMALSLSGAGPWPGCCIMSAPARLPAGITPLMRSRRWNGLGGVASTIEPVFHFAADATNNERTAYGGSNEYQAGGSHRFIYWI